MGNPSNLAHSLLDGGIIRVRIDSCLQGTIRRNKNIRPLVMHVPVACMVQGRIRTGDRKRQQEKQTRPSAFVGSVAAVASGPTFVQLAATVVGYVVVTGSMVRSVPQILRVIKNKSADGISIISIASQAVALLITAMYNWKKDYPFSSYGDAVTCNIQNLILIGIICRLRSDVSMSQIVIYSLLGVIFTVYLCVGATPNQLWILQASTMGIDTIGGKIPQIMSNIRRGDSGELSVVTSALSVAGFVARTFTHIVLTKDMLNLIGSTVLGLLNVYIFHQTLVTAGVYGTSLVRKKIDTSSASA